MKRKAQYLAIFTTGAVLLFAVIALNSRSSGQAADAKKGSEKMTFPVKKSKEELKKQLTPEQYRVTQQCGTEPPFTNKYYHNKETGTYDCIVCGNPLFTSDTKFESGSGWPSFFKPVDSNSVREVVDTSHGMVRTEIVCGKCGAHLGHVFDDGPMPTGLRYCVNSASLNFEKVDSTEAAKAPDTTEDKKAE